MKLEGKWSIYSEAIVRRKSYQRFVAVQYMDDSMMARSILSIVVRYSSISKLLLRSTKVMEGFLRAH